MKTNLLSMWMLLCVFVIKAQQPFVATPTVMPQNPSSTSIIKVLTKVTTANQGIIVDNNTFTVSGLQIRIKGCFWQGMLTATQDYIDTLTIGQLPAGNYQIIQKAFLSTTQQHCSIIDSNTVSLPIQVSQVTSNTKIGAIEKMSLYPNPCLNKIILEGIKDDYELSIFSNSGALVKKERLAGTCIDVSNLPAGLYFIILQDHLQNITHQQKILKLEE